MIYLVSNQQQLFETDEYSKISLDDANTRFINYISSIKIDDTLVNIMKNELQKRDLFK